MASRDSIWVSLAQPSVAAVLLQFATGALNWNTDGVYSQAVLDHFKNPRNAGDLPGATAEVEVSNPACGDIMRLSARIEGGRITEARFKTRGCVTAIACGSFLTELLVGKTLAEARAINYQQISDALGGLPSATMHGSQLACDALEVLLARL